LGFSADLSVGFSPGFSDTLSPAFSAGFCADASGFWAKLPADANSIPARIKCANLGIELPFLYEM
jgi:hypothetical protein